MHSDSERGEKTNSMGLGIWYSMTIVLGRYSQLMFMLTTISDMIKVRRREEGEEGRNMQFSLLR